MCYAEMKCSQQGTEWSLHFMPILLPPPPPRSPFYVWCRRKKEVCLWAIWPEMIKHQVPVLQSLCMSNSQWCLEEQCMHKVELWQYTLRQETMLGASHLHWGLGSSFAAGGGFYFLVGFVFVLSFRGGNAVSWLWWTVACWGLWLSLD